MRAEIEEHRARIATLRDELRLRVKQAGHEAHMLFEELEACAMRLTHEVSHAMHRSLAEVRNGYEYLATTLQPRSES